MKEFSKDENKDGIQLSSSQGDLTRFCAIEETPFFWIARTCHGAPGYFENRLYALPKSDYHIVKKNVVPKESADDLL